MRRERDDTPLKEGNRQVTVESEGKATSVSKERHPLDKHSRGRLARESGCRRYGTPLKRSIRMLLEGRLRGRGAVMGITSGQSSTAGCQGDLSHRMKTRKRRVFKANRRIFGKEDPLSTGPQDDQVIVRFRDQLRTRGKQ